MLFSFFLSEVLFLHFIRTSPLKKNERSTSERQIKETFPMWTFFFFFRRFHLNCHYFSLFFLFSVEFRLIFNLKKNWVPFLFFIRTSPLLCLPLRLGRLFFCWHVGTPKKGATGKSTRSDFFCNDYLGVSTCEQK